MIPNEYIDELHAALAARADAVCAALLKGGKRVGKSWQCGGVDGGPGKSMSVDLVGPKAGVWVDAATGESGRLLKLFELSHGVNFKAAVELAADFCRMSPPKEEDRKIDPNNFHFNEPSESHEDAPPIFKPSSHQSVIDWDRCVADFSPEKASELCEIRGYSPEFVTHLRNEKLIGCYKDSFAFPVAGANGKVTAIHYKGPEGWRYFPNGAESSIFVLGSPNHACHTLAFESQWDAFAVLDKLGAHTEDGSGVYAALVTRSATSNTDISKFAVPHLIACPQNDPKEKLGKDGITRSNINKEGRTPSEEWLFRIQASRNKISQFSVFDNPEPYKDSNDWIRGEQPDSAEVFSKIIERSKNPILKNTRSVRELLDHNVKDDPNSLIGFKNRFLSKGGSWMIIGPSGIGKSTLITSLCINAAAGVTWHGLTFRHPLKTLVIQAENDEGDLSEMLLGGLASVRANFSKSELITMGKNLMFEQVTDKIGEKFIRWLEEIIRESKAELVVIDPLLSFIGDDISQQKVVSQFFCHWLQPILHRTGVICVLIHHTGKPPKERIRDADLSYSGLGSSVLTSWPRAVSVMSPTDEEGVFRFSNCKRGRRAAMVNDFTGGISKDIFLQHGNANDGLQWKQVRYEEPEPDEGKGKEKKSQKKSSLPLDFFVDMLPSYFTYSDLFAVVRKEGALNAYQARGIIADLEMANLITKNSDGTYRKPEQKLNL